MPWQPEGPQKRYCFAQFSNARKDKPGVPKHNNKHCQKECQKTVAKPSAFKKTGRILFAGEAEATAEQSEKLSPAAIAIAVRLASADNSYDQRCKETQKSKPGKQYIKKPEEQI